MPSQKTFCLIAGLILFLIAFGHLLRIVFGWTLSISGWDAPMGASWAAVILGGYLGVVGLRHGSK